MRNVLKTESRQDPLIGAGIALGTVLFILYGYPGFLSPVTPHFDGACKAVALGASAEDIRIDASTGVAYMTQFTRLESDQRPRDRQGTVMLMDLNASEPRARAALATEPAGLIPVGLSIYAPASGPKRLFVVNRTGLGKNSIEIFEQSSTGAFAPVRTIKDPLLWTPTSIVAVGPNQFYATNESGFRDRDWADPRERIRARNLRDRRSNVVYFDGESMRIVARDLRRAYGVDVSPDGRTLYVGEWGGGRLAVFDRDVATGELKPRDHISLEAAPHNISVDAQGSVWIGARPRWLSAIGPTPNSPTQILKYTPGADPEVTEVYMSRGDQIASGSVAAMYGDRLVIGSMSDRKLLICTQDAASTAPSKPVIAGPEKET